MRKEGEIVITIDSSGIARIQIQNNDSPGHGEMLNPFEFLLSDGNRGAVQSHRHDHHDSQHNHQRGGQT